MKRLLLVGAPNAGKSTLFNALTGGHAKVGNWHGVTVGACEREAQLGGERVLVSDLPGIYSLDCMSMEEAFTRDYLYAHPSARVLFVCEYAALPRALELMRALFARGVLLGIVLTKKKAFLRGGGFADEARLSSFLRVPVFSVDGRSRRSVRDFRAALGRILKGHVCSGMAGGELPADAWRPVRAGLSRVDSLLSNGMICVPFFFLLLFSCFFVTFAPGLLGDSMKGCIEAFFTSFLAARAETVSSPVLRSFLVDGVLSGMGGVLCFLPQIALLFLALLLMEESGFLSRLAMHTDGIFAAVGLNGRAVFSLLMGFGCTAAAIMTTRGLDDKRIQRRTILCLPYIACSAKLPVFLTLSASLFEHPFAAVVLLYATGVGISFLAALLQKREGEAPFVLELAPLQIPQPFFVLRSLLFQIKQFIMKTATVILAFFLFSWLLSSFDFRLRLCTVEESMLAGFCGGFKYLFAPIGCCDWKIAYAAFSGLIAKENVAGMLAVFYGDALPFSAQSAFAFAVFILTCSPCVSAIAASARETGWRFALAAAACQTILALFFSYAVYFSLQGGAVYFFLLLCLIAAASLLGKHAYEKVHRPRRRIAEKIHR